MRLQLSPSNQPCLVPRPLAWLWPSWSTFPVGVLFLLSFSMRSLIVLLFFFVKAATPSLLCSHYSCNVCFVSLQADYAFVLIQRYLQIQVCNKRDDKIRTKLEQFITSTYSQLRQSLPSREK